MKLKGLLMIGAGVSLILSAALLASAEEDLFREESDREIALRISKGDFYPVVETVTRLS
jgi:hypothetical protein